MNGTHKPLLFCCIETWRPRRKSKPGKISDVAETAFEKFDLEVNADETT
jgi:hypothetical protein